LIIKVLALKLGANRFGPVIFSNPNISLRSAWAGKAAGRTHSAGSQVSPEISLCPHSQADLVRHRGGQAQGAAQVARGLEPGGIPRPSISP
jgi:hypothetical protein